MTCNVSFYDWKGLLNRLTRSIGALEARDGVATIAVVIDHRLRVGLDFSYLENFDFSKAGKAFFPSPFRHPRGLFRKSSNLWRKNWLKGEFWYTFYIYSAPFITFVFRFGSFCLKLVLCSLECDFPRSNFFPKSLFLSPPREMFPVFASHVFLR